MASIVKTSAKIAPKRKQRMFPVWVVVRHTRAGDDRRAVINQGTDPKRTRDMAMEMAEEIANEAANHYGQGSASVFAGKLTLAAKAEMP